MLQKLFLKSTDNDDIVESEQAWHVGLTYTTESAPDFTNTRPTAWTSKCSKVTRVPAPLNCGWYLFNIQSIGTIYDLHSKIINVSKLIMYNTHKHT